jgi:hypothetical protein
MASLQGWGRQTWNSGAWNTFAPVDATGNGLTSSLGSLTLTGDCNITLTGVSTTSTTGTAVGTGVAEVTATGNAITSNLGTETVTGSSTHTVTGLGTTVSLGDETASTLFQSGWDRGVAGDSGVTIGWSDNLWNTTAQSYALTGVQGSTATGSPTINISVAPTITGVGLTSSTNTPGTSVFVTGVSSTSSIGTFSISGDSQVTVVAASEPQLDISIGTESVEIGKTAFPSGNALSASLGTEVVTGNAIVSPTGIALTSSRGSPTISGSAPVTVNGTNTQMSSLTGDGVVTAGATVALTGISMTSAIGDASQSSVYEAPSVAATLSTGALQIRIDVSFTVTGVSATSSTGNLQGTFWSAVDDSNSAISWTEVHQAA